jgi:hypothetical protein
LPGDCVLFTKTEQARARRTGVSRVKSYANH